MPIISDGNNQIGDEITDRHMTVGVTKHTGSYHVSGTDGNYILVNSDDMSLQMSVAPGGANFTATPHIGVFDNATGVQPTIAIGRGDDTKSFGGQFALSRLSSTGSVGIGDVLGSIVAMGHDGTDFNTGAEIRFAVENAVATDRLPTKIEFMTNPGASSTVFPATRMTVGSDGNVGIGTSGQQDKLFVNGTVGVGSSDASDLNLKVTGSAIIAGNVSGDYVTLIDNDNGSSGHGLKVTSDGTGTGTNILDLESASTTFFRARGDGRIGIGKVTSLPASVLTVSSSNTDSDISIAHKIHHIGDADTSISFDDNTISFEAGGSTQFQVLNSSVKVDGITNYNVQSVDLGSGTSGTITPDSSMVFLDCDSVAASELGFFSATVATSGFSNGDTVRLVVTTDVAHPIMFTAGLLHDASKMFGIPSSNAKGASFTLVYVSAVSKWAVLSMNGLGGFA